MAYTVIAGGSTLSGFVNQLQVQHECMRTFERGETEPTVKPTGLLWVCTNSTILTAAGAPGGITEAMLQWTGSAWKYILAFTTSGGGGVSAILANGTVPFTANQPMGTFKLTGLAAGTGNGDSVRWEQVPHLADLGGGDIQFDCVSKRLVNLAAPVNPSDALRLGDLPAASGQVWFGGNRHPTHVVARDTDISVGFTPRQLVVRLFGRGVDADDRDINGGRVDTTITFNRWDADSTGGFSGTPASQTIKVDDLDGVWTGINVTVTWLTGGTKGFKIQFFHVLNNEALSLANPSNAAVDGAWQVIAINDPVGG